MNWYALQSPLALSVNFSRVDPRFGVAGGTGWGGSFANSPWTLLVGSLVFALVAIPPHRLRSWRSLDVLALVSFTVSQLCFAHRALDASIVAAYPPLVYFALRLGWIVFRGNPPVADMNRWQLPSWALWLVAAIGIVIRDAVHSVQSTVSDIGYAGYVGATRLLHHQQIYAAPYPASRHLDSYPPLMYVAYVPARLIAHGTDAQQLLSTVRNTGLLFDMLVLAALYALALRWFDIRVGGWLVAAWISVPPTMFALMNNVNDGFIAAILVASLLAWNKPYIRGLVLGIGGATKLVPLAAIPAVEQSATKMRSLAWTILGALTAICAAVLLAGGTNMGLADFVERSIAFQSNRPTAFSIWQLWHMRELSHVLEFVAALVLLTVPWLGRLRGLSGAAAGTAFAMVLLQLTSLNWLHSYLLWIIAPMLVWFAAEDTLMVEVNDPT